MKSFSETNLPFEIRPPADVPEYMYPAYFSCLVWAIRFEPILHKFIDDTGIEIPKPRSPMEQVIDEATGHQPYLNFVQSFVPWFNHWIWGKMDGPDE